MIKCQCNYCQHMMGLPDKMSGRKILCPLCNDPMEIPAPDAKTKFKKFSLGDSIDRFQLTDWDKAFARNIFASGKVEEGKLYKAIAAFMKAKRKTRDLSLAEDFVKNGIITQKKRESIREEIKGKIKTKKVEFVECPNCFANIESNSHACKFCGQRIGDKAFDTCPACKHEQPKGSRHCQKCNANIKTGLKETISRCPACNKLVYGDPAKCPNCKAILKKPGTRRKSEEKRQRNRRSVVYLVGGGIVGILVLGCLAYSVICNALKSGAEKQADILVAALIDEDLDSAGQVLGGKLGKLEEKKWLRALCTGVDTGPEVSRVNSVRILESSSSDSGTTLTVLVRVKLKPPLDDEAISLFQKPKNFTVLWKWRKTEGTWLLVGTEEE